MALVGALFNLREPAFEALATSHAVTRVMISSKQTAGYIFIRMVTFIGYLYFIVAFIAIAVTNNVQIFKWFLLAAVTALKMSPCTELTHDGRVGTFVSMFQVQCW